MSSRLPNQMTPPATPGESVATAQKVVPLRAGQPARIPGRLDPRLEELRRILAQAEPIGGIYSDEEVVADESKFRKRFGPGFHWNQRDRQGLMALKKRYDLTDSEIKMFHHTGNLHRSMFGVRVSASPWIALWGGVQIVYFGVLFFLLLLAAWPNLIAGTAKAAKPLLLLIALAVFCWGLHWVYVKPWLLRRSKEREESVRG